MVADPSSPAARGPAETIGVDVGGTKMLIGAVDADRRVTYRAERPSAGRDADELLAVLGDELERALAERPAASAVGLGLPCTIDRERGAAITAVNLPLVDVPVRDRIAARLHVPVFVDNDANLAALAEQRFGAARGARHVVMLTLGTGIGGGVVADGELLRGASGAGGELGHVVIDMDGPRCQGNCPNRGCVEAMASGTALGRDGREAAREHPDSALGELVAAGATVDGRAVTRAALAGDAVARSLVERAGRRLGVALSSLANAFEPEVFVIGGGVMRVGEMLLEPARAELRTRALPPMNAAPVLAAALGPDAGMFGAAAMAAAEAVGG